MIGAELASFLKPWIPYIIGSIALGGFVLWGYSRIRKSAKTEVRLEHNEEHARDETKFRAKAETRLDRLRRLARNKRYGLRDDAPQ